TSDIFIFPSFREGLSLALMEAMSVGIPIICSNIRGNNDLIEHNVSGYLIDPNNEKEISDYINKIVSSDKIRNKLINNVRDKIKNFNITTVKSMFKKIYTNIK